MATRNKYFFGLAIIGVGILLGLLLVFGTKSYPVAMSCDKAIDEQAARQLWDENQDVIHDLEASHPSSTGFSVRLDTSICPEKAFMHIDYDTDKIRSNIDSVLRKSPLKAVPVEWQNV